MIYWFPPRVSLPAPVTELEVYSMVGGGAQVVDRDEGLLAAPPDTLQSRTVYLFPLRVGPVSYTHLTLPTNREV